MFSIFPNKERSIVESLSAFAKLETDEVEVSKENISEFLPKLFCIKFSIGVNFPCAFILRKILAW